MLASVIFGQDIHFKTRTLQTGPPDARGAADPTATTAAFEPAATDAGKDTSSIHKIIQFDHSPGLEDLDALLQDGLQVVGALPDNAVMVAAPGGQVPARPGRRWIGRMETPDKLSPELATVFTEGEFAVVSALVVVEFHTDVTAGRQETVAGAEGLTLLRSGVLRPDHALLRGTYRELLALAAHDEVAYVFPADPDLLTGAELLPCLGMLTSSGPVGQYTNIVHGWNLDADNVAHLGYFFGSVTPKVPAALVQSEVVRALTEWTRHANIMFQPAASASAQRNVVVKFVSGAHGDAWPFDGPGGILAHTFYPVPVNAESLAGDIHMDADENWHAGGDLDVYSVALHEAGHAIGLGHSDRVGDVMYPYYRSHPTLSANDIGAAQLLYGVGTATPAATSAQTATPVSGPVAPPPLPLRVVPDTMPQTVQTSSLSLTGTLSGGTTPYSVQWQTDHGYSGRAALTAKAWTATGITLVNGINTITVTAFDAANQSASQSAATSLAAPPQPPSTGNSHPVSISVTSPASSVSAVNAATLTASGTATGGAGITRVTWQTAAGAGGTASGTGKWLAQGIPLLTGTNTVILRAWDSNGNFGWTTLIAVRH